TLVSKMMASGIASGFYIGLPTMATANAMYERMGTCYRKFFSEAEKPSIVLSHGSRHMSEVFRSSFLMNSASDTLAGYDETSAEANAGKFYCTNWLADSTKKSLLADIGIGTIDQLLLSILPVRYQDLRLYGMKNKVLVVDEVHAYDPYMNKLLCAVLKAHIAAGGSAVLLSATIPQVLKRKLVDSYYEGLGEDYWYDQKVDNFPLLTKADKDNGLQEIPVKSFQKKRHVTIEFLYEEERIYKKITNSIKENICISWIRNTVYDVLEAYEKLTCEYGVSEENIIVFHSRFAYADRSRIEEKVIRLFGKNSKQNERAGKVVIATQVIEQSLDLDFDVMVSDLAPVELIIQRAGRLQRHDHGDRCKPVMYIYSPPETDNPEAEWYQNVFPKASGVYRNTAILWRTKEILKKEEAIVLPQRARLLIESVYGDDPIQAPECFSENEIDALGETLAKEDTADFSKLSLENGYCRESAINEWDEEERITTRLSDEQCTVYICFFDGERIKPLYEGEFPWEMSSLKIRKGKIKKVNYQGEINKAIEQKKAERNFRQDDIFLIADRNSNSNEIVKMEFENLYISYSNIKGLQVEKK
ncbi:MAG: CRISPR-associated helicase Cas3', partial [Victivallales bacterium]|nr:CRISPR-associated helicase Cas3' [Victivallales bacterium]